MFSAAGAAAWAQGTTTFSVQNSGNVPLADVRVSPDYATRWGGNQLTEDTLEPGERLEVEVDRASGSCFFDVQVNDVQGNRREFWGFNACNDRTLSVRRAAGTAIAPDADKDD